jgi:hypothetical protein
MLAWGPMLGLSLLAAAPVFTGGKLQAAVGLAMIIGGTLSLAGTLGPASGDLRFWYFAMTDSIVVLPVTCGLLAIHFRASSSHFSAAAPLPR